MLTHESNLILENDRTRSELLKNEGWPDALVKAANDSFFYLAYVKNLGLVRFTSADYASHGWVHLNLDGQDDNEGLPEPFCRGLDVRLKDIRWVADAPKGS